jgi:branched-chain amino acid transport system permease protein
MINREAGVFQTSYRGDLALYTLPLARITVCAVLGLLLILPLPLSLLQNAHAMSIVNTIALAAIGAIGLNILNGYTGQISLGQGAFMAVGGYTAAILSSRYGMPFWFGIIAGGSMAALVGTLFGIPSLRIKGLYLAIATLAAQLIIEWTINHVPWIGGGTILDLRCHADLSGPGVQHGVSALLLNSGLLPAGLLCGPEPGAFAGGPRLHCHP